MPQQRKFKRNYPAYFLIPFLIVAGASWFLLVSIKERLIENAYQNLEHEARLVAGQAAGLFSKEKKKNVQEIVRKWETDTGQRYTLVDPSGKALADSREVPDRMENHAGRPEFQEALARKSARSVYEEPHGDTQWFVVASPVLSGETLKGAIIVSSLQSKATDEWKDWVVWFFVSFGIAGSLLIWAIAFTSRQIWRNFLRIEKVAGRFSSGEIAAELSTRGRDEFDGVSMALNQMSQSMNERIQELTSQRNEVEAILSSMVEGVLAVDPNEKILRVNAAASRLFGVNANDVCGRRFQEAFRNTELRNFIKQSLESSQPIDAEFLVQSEGEKIVHAEAPLSRARTTTALACWRF